MKILNLLEQLANNVHHNIDITELLCGQSYEIQKAFLTNNSIKLRSQIGHTENLADKSAVVQIKL